jgi:hypothetical protein
MSESHNEVSRAEEHRDMSEARTSGVIDNRDGSPSNRPNSSLPLVAGLSTPAQQSQNRRGGKSSQFSGAKNSNRKEKRTPQIEYGRSHQPGQAREKLRQDKFDVSKLAKAVQSYHFTDVYSRGVSGGFKDKSALDKFNCWVKEHVDAIDPKSTVVCGHCGAADLLLCEHFVTNSSSNAAADGALVINAPLRTQYYFSFQIIDGLKKMLLWPTFDFARQNNRLLGGFSNSDISDDNLIPELYNYVKLRMQTSYTVNGKEDRALRLAHCSRLSHKWLESRKLKIEDDTGMTNRVMFTIQRVCDNAENQVLYGHTDPTDNFLLARVEKWTNLAIFFILYVLWGRIVMYLLPRVIALAIEYALPSALRSWTQLFLTFLNAMLVGSRLLCYEMIFSPFSNAGVVVAILAALSTYLYSISKRR